MQHKGTHEPMKNKTIIWVGMKIYTFIQTVVRCRNTKHIRKRRVILFGICIDLRSWRRRYGRMCIHHWTSGCHRHSPRHRYECTLIDLNNPRYGIFYVALTLCLLILDRVVAATKR
jgi:hypothetical protein